VNTETTQRVPGSKHPGRSTRLTPADVNRPVSYSELDTFRQCPLKWQLGYAQGWKPSYEKEAFRLGHAWHSIMEAHYTVIKEWQERNHGEANQFPVRGSYDETELLEMCARDVGYAVMDKLDCETRILMEWAYSGYVEAHGCDSDWRIIAIEIRGQVPFTPEGRELVYVIDLVVEDANYGGVWIVDHKFPGDLASDTEMDLDDQLGLYWFAWSASGHELAHRVNGAMLNEARKKQNAGDKSPREFYKNGKPKGTPQTLDQRFRRTRTTRTPAELNIIAEDARQVVHAMEAGIIYSSPNPKQCSWKCDFKEIHIQARSGALPIAEILSDFGFTSRDEREAGKN
jgi:hypothetical protein